LKANAADFTDITGDDADEEIIDPSEISDD
jgi:hypothetical protein